MFVAFDLEEYNTQCDTFRPLRPIACGSNAYVKNLTKYFQTNGGTIGGALILETILNHDSNPGEFLLYARLASSMHSLRQREIEATKAMCTRESFPSVFKNVFISVIVLTPCLHGPRENIFNVLN